MADERQRLIQAFVDSGRPVKDLVVAWTGLYPFWRGYSNYGYFFTLRRCVVLREGQLEVWTTWSGLPSKSLAEAPIVASGYARLGRKYDRFDVGDFRVWIAADDRVRIDEWLARGQSGQVQGDS